MIMKVKTLIIMIGAIAAFISSCTKIEPDLSVDIVADKTNVIAGEEITFTINGHADFVTFYNGLDSSSTYDYYPFPVDEFPLGTGARKIKVKDKSFTQVYTNMHGIVVSTAIASSNGAWGEEEVIKRFDFEISVTDNRTGISEVTIRKSGLGGAEYATSINNENHTITFTVPEGTNVSKIVTKIIPLSTGAMILDKDGNEFKNNTVYDYSSGSLAFKVLAADGVTIQDWIIQVVFG